MHIFNYIYRMKSCEESVMRGGTVAIIEPSPALGLGVQTLIERYAPEFCVAGVYLDLDLFHKQVPRELDMILIDTAVIGYSQYVNVRKLFPNHTETLLVALTIEQILPETTASFDGVLHIYSSLEQTAQQLKAIFNTSAARNGCDTPITEREKDIIIAVAKGMNNKEIADNIHLSPHTVMTYRQRISSKLGIKGTAAFTTYAMRHNLI